MDFNPIKIIQIAYFLKKEKIDIIILNINKDVRIAGIAAHLARIPVILARHGTKLISDKFKDRLTLSLVDGIITNTNSIKQEYKSYKWMPENKIKVIYNGINIPQNVVKLNLREIYNIPENHFIFGSAGGLSKVKCFDLLIKAVAILRKKNLPITLLIAGKGNMEYDLKNLIKQEKLEDYVQLIGFLENPLEFINSLDAFVLSSKFEGMPNVVLEAMALGKIVIATNVGGISELIEDSKNGFIVKARDIGALARSMEMLMKQNNNKLAKIGEQAINTIKERFTMEKMINHLEEYINRKYYLSSRI